MASYPWYDPNELLQLCGLSMYGMVMMLFIRIGSSYQIMLFPCFLCSERAKFRGKSRLGLETSAGVIKKHLLGMFLSCKVELLSFLCA